MATTLGSLSTRVSQTLTDTSNVIWAAAAVSEGIRTALGEYNLAQKVETPGATDVFIKDLDSAANTTLPATHDTLIVWGAAAYCAQARAVDRADSYQLGAKVDQLKAWGDQRLREFKAMLAAVFPAYLAVMSGQAGATGEDPAKLAAEIALLGAQASLANSESAASVGQEARAADAANAAAADKAAEVTRKAGLRTTSNPAFGSWEDDGADEFDGGKP